MRAVPGIAMAATAYLLAVGGILASGLLVDARQQPVAAILLAQAAAALPVLVLLPRLPVRQLGLGATSWRGLGLGLVCGLVGCVLSFLALLLTLVFVGPPPEQPIQQVIGAVHAWAGWPGLLLLAAILPGLVEEALFRGVILSGLRRWLSPGPAVVLTALAFAALHLSPWRFLPQFALGCLLGWLSLRCGSCWPAAAGHALHNAVWLAVEILARPPATA